MSEDEKDYSDYIAWISNLSTVRAIVTGFTFTVLTLLLIQLPDPSQIPAQITLFFLSILLDLWLFLVYDDVMTIARAVKRIPSFESADLTSLRNVLSQLATFLWGLTVVFMFLLWNLIYLALASGVVWLSFISLMHFRSYRPTTEHWKKSRFQS